MAYTRDKALDTHKDYKENIEYIGSLFLLVSTILAIYTGYKYVILVIENKDSLTNIKND